MQYQKGNVPIVVGLVDSGWDQKLCQYVHLDSLNQRNERQKKKTYKQLARYQVV